MIRKANRQLLTGVSKAYADHVNYRRQAALRALSSFLLTFIFLRGLTAVIHFHLLPIHDITTGSGLHIHHFVWGIFILIAVGFLGLVLDQDRWHPLLAIPFGIAAALVIDEFALWLNLQDVYWARQGRSSVDAAIILASLLGIYYAAERFWRQATRELMIAARIVRSI